MLKTERLGKEKIGKLLWQFALPSVVGLLAHAVYNITDRIFVGRGVGAEGMAGVVHAFPIMLAHFSVAVLIGGGAAALISIRLGEKKKALAEKILGNAVLLFLISIVVLTIFTLVFLDDLLGLMAITEAVKPHARDYMQVIFGGTICMLGAFVLSAFIRAEGNPNLAMWLLLISSALNVVFDPILIFGFDMGVRGAAIATVAAQAFAALWAVFYYACGKSVLRFHLQNLRPCLKTIKAILVIGLAPCLMEMAFAVQLGAMNFQLQAFGGANAVAALGIVFAVIAFIFLPLLGITEGVQPILGYNFGAKHYARVKSTLYKALVGAFIFAIVGSAAAFVLARTIATFFFVEQNPLVGTGDDKIVIDIAVRGMRIFVILFPLAGIDMIGARYFQAIGKAKKSLVLSISRQVLIFLPCVILFPAMFGLDGVWYTGPATDIFAALLVGVMLYYEIRKLNRQEHLQQAHLAAK